MFLIYSFIYTIAVLFLFLPEYLKRPVALRGKWLWEKLGTLPSVKASIWVHAVSVGEVNASLPLLNRLKSAYPDRTLILSTITDTGQKVARDKSPEGTVVVYLPFDIGVILKHCFNKVRPGILIIMETELWPNLLRTAAGSNIPVLMINGRISEKSSIGYRKISFFMKRVFSFVDKFGMQSNLDAGRLISIGADKQKVLILGNLKFDMQLSDKVPDWIGQLNGPVIVAGSTHKGEEELILSAFLENINRFPGLKLVIAPRRPERFWEVADMIASKGVPFVRRSAIGGGSEVAAGANVILLDTVGELSAVYGIASLAIIGKSFTGTGGQNPLEPAYWGRPIICGPHMENFPFIEEFYSEGAAFKTDPQRLSSIIRELLDAPDKMKAAGNKAREIFNRNADAADRAIKLINGYMKNR